jgi:hypothetical protein
VFFFYEENHALSAVVIDYNDFYLHIFDIIGFVYQYLSGYEKFRLNNGYLRNYRILETWNLDLQKSNLRMIMLQNLQVCLC